MIANLRRSPCHCALVHEGISTMRPAEKIILGQQGAQSGRASGAHVISGVRPISGFSLVETVEMKACRTVRLPTLEASGRSNSEQGLSGFYVVMCRSQNSCNRLAILSRTFLWMISVTRAAKAPLSWRFLLHCPWFRLNSEHCSMMPYGNALLNNHIVRSVWFRWKPAQVLDVSRGAANDINRGTFWRKASDIQISCWYWTHESLRSSTVILPGARKLWLFLRIP